MHLREAIVPGQTIVWTAAFQAAWDALGDRLGGNGGIPLGSPVPPEDVRVLNLGRLAPGTIDSSLLTVVSGPASEETWTSIDRASGRARPPDAPLPDANDWVAFARLRASLAYEIPFEVHPMPFAWGDSPIAVRAYGFRADASGAAADRRRSQVRVHLNRGSGQPARSAVAVLRGRDGSRLVLSARPPERTLAETWAEVAAFMAKTPADELNVTDSLTIPRVVLRASRSYDALVGAPIEGVPGASLALARQDVTLRADERGADVDAEAVLVAYGAIPLEVSFDGPFLLAMLAPESATPYAVAWIGSVAALARWDAPVGERLERGDAAPYSGRWTLDRDASSAATFERQRKALGGHGSGSSSLKDLRSDVQRHFDGRDFELVAAVEGDVRVRSRWSKGDAEREIRGELRLEDGRVLLTVQGPVERRWTLTLVDGRLLLHSDETNETLVLVAR